MFGRRFTGLTLRIPNRYRVRLSRLPNTTRCLPTDLDAANPQSDQLITFQMAQFMTITYSGNAMYHTRYATADKSSKATFQPYVLSITPKSPPWRAGRWVHGSPISHHHHLNMISAYLSTSRPTRSTLFEPDQYPDYIGLHSIADAVSGICRVRIGQCVPLFQFPVVASARRCRHTS